MSSKEILEKLKTFLSKEDKKVELETAEIKDADVVIEAESFDVGNEVFVIADVSKLGLRCSHRDLCGREDRGNINAALDQGQGLFNEAYSCGDLSFLTRVHLGH